MKRKNLFELRVVIALIFSVLTITTFAQTITVTGTVSDTNSEPVIGASVIILGHSNLGTVTNSEGIFTLPNVPSNSTLRVSYVGLLPQEIAVNGQRNINVTMQQDLKSLERGSSNCIGY